MTESKVQIPIPPRGANELGEQGTLIGILRRQDSSTSTAAPRPITLILHGVLAHKDQLFHRLLAQTLSTDSFRFDFRHAVQGGESSGSGGWDMASFGKDVLDIHTVVLYLRRAYNYHVETIVSHSRGTLNAWQYYWDIAARRAGMIENEADGYLLDNVPFLVALAGRMDMGNMRERFPRDMQDFRTKGYYEWKVRVASKNFSVKVTDEMTERFCTFPQGEMVNKFPNEADCLLVHGTKDATVPVQDIFAYRDKLLHHVAPPRRRDGDTQIHLIEGADHTFKGHFDEIVRVTCQWLDGRRTRVADDEADASPAAQAFAQRCPLGSASTDISRLQGSISRSSEPSSPSSSKL